MDDELSPTEKSRELVLGIPVQLALAEVEPINCHPPVPPVRLDPPVVEIDTSSSFATDKAFATRDELIEWARKVALELKFSIVIEKSDYGGNKRRQKLVLGCERGGVYKPSKKKSKFEETGTRKCGCPFRLCGYFHSTNDWHLRVVNEKHNHEFDKVLEGHCWASET
ncbi:protein FAR1-RELATED SEQUENCE [Trifolium repens]|nr:protein FAR1-RELATED SEQUENCE [Trifolium repens]